MSTPVHKLKAETFVSYAYQEADNDEEEEDEEELELSDEEELYDGDYDDDYDDDDSDGDEFEDDFDYHPDYNDQDNYEFDENYDSDIEQDDDHEFFHDEEDSHYRNNYEAGPGYFYPEQPYISLKADAMPSPEASPSKFTYYVLSPICDIATIYMKFAILAILISACALWYTVHYGDLSSLPDMNDIDDADTCPAN